VILLQGAVGFVQYFTDLPVVLVALHMLGAALVSAAVTWVLVEVREPQSHTNRGVGTTIRMTSDDPTGQGDSEPVISG
jgi:heme A synthase